MKKLLTILFIFSIFPSITAQYYSGIFKSREIYKKGCCTIEVFIPKRTTHKIKSIHRVIIKKLEEENWQPIKEVNSTINILIYEGVNANKYKTGKMIEGNSFVILTKGKDVIIPIEDKNTRTYSFQIIKEIQKSLNL